MSIVFDLLRYLALLIGYTTLACCAVLTVVGSVAYFREQRAQRRAWDDELEAMRRATFKPAEGRPHIATMKARNESARWWE